MQEIYFLERQEKQHGCGNMETSKGLLWEGFGNGHGFNSVHFKLYLAHFSVNCLGNSKHCRLGMVPWATMKPWIKDLPCSGNMTGNCFEDSMDSPFEWPNTALNLSHIQIRVCRVECDLSNFLLTPLLAMERNIANCLASNS